MLPLDAIGKADTISYSLNAICALPAAILDGLCFDNFPERHGFAALNVLIPKSDRYGKLNPPVAYLQTGAAVRRWRKIIKED